MAKKSLLLVDADLKSRRLLEVTFRRAGFSVACADTAPEALAMARFAPPDLILSDTVLPGMDGFDLAEDMKRDQQLSDVPFMFLSSDVSLQSRIRGLELGIGYLMKPTFIKEVVMRVQLELHRKEREVLALQLGPDAFFSGLIADMGVVDLLQTVTIGKRAGELSLRSGSAFGMAYIRDGQVIAAEVGVRRGEAAVYRMLTWNAGIFNLRCGEVTREQEIFKTTPALLMDAVQKLDAWDRLQEQLPPMSSVYKVDARQLMAKLKEIPDEVSSVLKHFDGQRSVLSVLDEVNGDDIETLEVISKLHFEGLLVRLRHEDCEGASEPRRENGEYGVPSRVSDLDALHGYSISASRSSTQSPAVGDSIRATLGYHAGEVIRRVDTSDSAPHHGGRQDSDGPALFAPKVTLGHGVWADRRDGNGDLSEGGVEGGVPPERTGTLLQFPGLVHSSTPVVDGSVTDRGAVAFQLASEPKAARVESEIPPASNLVSGIPMPTGGPFTEPDGSGESGPADELEREFRMASERIARLGKSRLRWGLGAAFMLLVSMGLGFSLRSQGENHAPAKSSADKGRTEGRSQPDDSRSDVRSLRLSGSASVGGEPATVSTASEGMRAARGIELSGLGVGVTRSASASARPDQERALRQRVAAEPTDARAHSELAFYLLASGNAFEAAVVARKSAMLDPSGSKSWITLGAALQELRQGELAKVVYKYCVRFGTGKYVRECQLMNR